MANDRLIIRCDGCKAWVFVMKMMGNGLYVVPDQGKVVDWLNQHGECHPHAFGAELYGVPGFSFHTENAATPTEISPDLRDAKPLSQRGSAMNLTGNEWFNKYHAVNVTDEFKAWWIAYYGRPSDHEQTPDEQAEYWTRCGFTLVAWNAARAASETPRRWRYDPMIILNGCPTPVVPDCIATRECTPPAPDIQGITC